MTYNQIVNEIQTLLESHKMIHTVKFATPVQWLNWDNQPVFPLASFAIDRGGLNAGREQTYEIQMWFLDKSGVDSEFETDVVSDMHSVAADIISTLRRGSNPYTIDTSISWDAVSEKFEDYLSGVYLTFNLSVVSAYDACSMPI
jgi:hypothetical protein